MTKERRGAAFWHQLIEEYDASERSQEDFAREKGVSKSTFLRWLYKARADGPNMAGFFCPGRT